jgi:hypothetical protein
VKDGVDWIMRKASVQRTLQRLKRLASLYERTFVDVIGCDLSILDLEQKLELVEALAIRLCTTWSFSVEDLMIDCLNRDSTKFAQTVHAKSLPKNLPRNLCELLLTGPGYFDVKNIADLKAKGNKYLVDAYNPFKSISKNDAVKINELIIIRNFVTHYSTRSRHALHEEVYKTVHQRKKFKHPGPFLIAKDAKTGRPRMHAYFDSVQSAATLMAAALRVDI